MTKQRSQLPQTNSFVATVKINFKLSCCWKSIKFCLAIYNQMSVRRFRKVFCFKKFSHPHNHRGVNQLLVASIECGRMYLVTSNKASFSPKLRESGLTILLAPNTSVINKLKICNMKILTVRVK